MVVILSSYVSIAVGALLLGLGFFARRRGNEYGRYLLGGGGLLVLLGVLGLLWFVTAFG
ncbi:MAG: hypothetical protein ACOCSP_02215 [archaeon]